MDSSTCARLAQVLEPYADGELPEVLAACVQAHIGECADCARKVAELAATHSLVNEWPVLEREDFVAANLRRESLVARFASLYPPAAPTTPAAARTGRQRRSPLRRSLYAGARAAAPAAGALLAGGVRLAWRLGKAGFVRMQSHTKGRQGDAGAARPAVSRVPGSRRPAATLARMAAVLRRAPGRSVPALG